MGWEMNWESEGTMNTALPLVGIPCDVIRNGLHGFQGAGEKYINAAAHGAGAMPVLLPVFGNGEDLKDLATLYSVDDIVDRIDGLFLTGSPSNVHPDNYQGAAPKPGTQEDRQRDSLTLQLIRACIARSVPVLAICRGFQELNVALGGSLHAAVHEVPGYADHREDKTLDRNGQYGPRHRVNFVEQGLLHRLSGELNYQVNSLHGQGVDRLAAALAVEARADDGVIEAVSLINESNWVLGLQWHPEWQYLNNPLSVAIFAEFGQQIRKFR